MQISVVIDLVDIPINSVHSDTILWKHLLYSKRLDFYWASKQINFTSWYHLRVQINNFYIQSVCLSWH